MLIGRSTTVATDVASLPRQRFVNNAQHLCHAGEYFKFSVTPDIYYDYPSEFPEDYIVGTENTAKFFYRM